MAELIPYQASRNALQRDKQNDARLRATHYYCQYTSIEQAGNWVECKCKYMKYNKNEECNYSMENAT